MPPSTSTVGPFLEDASGYHGTAERVVFPSTSKEVRAIVNACSAQNLPLTVAGAGTGLTGARVPHGGWVISLEKFRTIQIQKGSARCGASVTLADLSVEAAKTKQFFGPNPTETSASIGGIIATNAGGARSFHYGSVRRHVLALEVTFMDGRTVEFKRGEKVDFPVRTVSLPKTTKNAAGYYLQPDLEWVDLLSGSEGTLGIVTEAEVRLFPEPAAILSGVVFFPSDRQALDAVDAWRPIPELRLLEYMDAAALGLLRGLYPEIPGNALAALLVNRTWPLRTTSRWISGPNGCAIRARCKRSRGLDLPHPSASASGSSATHFPLWLWTAHGAAGFQSSVRITPCQLSGIATCMRIISGAAVKNFPGGIQSSGMWATLTIT